jgi:hypothetical protein
MCLTSGCVEHFLLGKRSGVKEGLHWRLAVTPAALMWPPFIVSDDPSVEVCLQLLDADVDALAEGDLIELVQHRLVKTLADPITGMMIPVPVVRLNLQGIGCMVRPSGTRGTGST